MADTIKIPGLGKVSKPTALALGGAAVVVTGVAWYRARNAPADTGGGGPAEDTGINPATGFPYGSEQDYAALGQMGAVGGGGPGYAYYGGDGSNTSGGGNAYPQGFTINSQWSQAAEDYLVNTVHSGQNADVIGNALGKYITGQPLTDDQVAIVTQAIAFTGYPPVNGPTGYPPSFRTAATPTTPPPGKPPAGKTLPKVTGLRVVGTWRDAVQLDWNQVKGAIGYAVYINGERQRGSVVYDGWTAKGLKHPGTRYSFGVAPIGADNQLGPRASITAVTKRK